MPKSLPSHPNLENLKNQAKSLLNAYRDGKADAYARISASFPKLENATAEAIREADFGLQDAQLVLAREYGFASWTALRERVVEYVGGIEHAIRSNDPATVRSLLQGRPELLSGDVAWSSERLTVLACAVRHGSPEVTRAVLEAGYDVRVDGDSTFQHVVPRGGGDQTLAELLVEFGVDPRDNESVLFQLTEGLDADGVRWMLERGANPDYRTADKEHAIWTPLDNALHTYLVDPKRRQETVRALLDAGAVHEDNALFDLLAGQMDRLRERLDAQPDLVNAHFDIHHDRVTSLEFGGHYGGGPLKQTTLLHHCAEFGFLDEALMLLERGADVNARAEPFDGKYNNHTPIFHALTTNTNNSFPVLQLLVDHGADVHARASLEVFVWARDRRGDHYRMRDVTPLGYIQRFPNDYWKTQSVGSIEERTERGTTPHTLVIELLHHHGASE
jgi:hypothetical protein